MGYAVIQLYDPIRKTFTDPKVVERLEAIRICLDQPAVAAPMGDSIEEAVWKYWMSRSH